MLRRLLAASAVALLLTPAAHAESMSDSSSLLDAPLSFWIYLDRTTSDWDIGDATVNSEIDRIGFAFAQQYEPWLKAGLFGGFSGLTQTDNPPTEGISQSGGHFGMLLQMLPYRGERFKIDTGLNLSYNYVDNTSQDQEVETSWGEGLVYAKGILTLSPVILSLGGNYQYINGTEKLSGSPLNQNNDIKADENVSGLAGIDLMVGGGTIGLHGEWGARESFAITFARNF
jgi:hypothetical protein